jgi:hypothetical protein
MFLRREKGRGGEKGGVATRGARCRQRASSWFL